MQAVTVLMGVFLASTQHEVNWWILVPLLLGTLLTASGAAALNHFLERNVDGLMNRTKNRPIPSGTIPAWIAAVFASVLLFAGLAVLWFWTNSWVTFLSFLTAFLYVVFYTPLKQMTWLNTYIGAIPGAIPPLAGWGAVAGGLSPAAWGLFWIMFFWQMPHFFAIAWMYRNDYGSAGFKMLPSEDESGHRTFFHMLVNSVLFALVCILPVVRGYLGSVYLGAVLALCGWQLVSVWKFRASKDRDVALRIMKVSVAVLPFILVAIIADILI